MKGQAKIEEKARQYCALTVTAVAGLASAGVAAYGSYSQSKAQGDAAKQAQAAAEGNPAGMYGSKLELPDYVDNTIADPKTGSFGRDMFEDFNDSLPMLFEISNSMNARNINMRNRLAGGKQWTNALRQQGENINSLLQGEIPTDVQDTIQRYVAERVGGGVNIGAPGQYAGGGSQMGTFLARSLGQTSVDMMDKGMSYAPQWEQMIDQFTYKPTDALAGVQPFMSAAQIQLQRDNAMYESGVNKSLAAAQADPQVAGLMNDRLKMSTIQSQADANQARALAGLISGAAGGATSLYNSFKPTTAPVGKPTGYSYDLGYKVPVAQRVA